jgi:lipoprotein-releasing system permease protein
VPLELFVAFRYLLARRQHASISRVSLFSTIGVGIGVMALVVALAMMTGVQGELRDRILGSTADVYVWKIGGLDDYVAEAARLRAIDGVVGAAPALMGAALLRSEAGEALVQMKGIDPSLEGEVTAIGTSMQEGSLDALAQGAEDERPGLLIGTKLAENLGVRVGDLVRVISSSTIVLPTGEVPRTRTLRVVGIYALGLYEFDAAYGLVELGIAGRMFAQDLPDLLMLKVEDIWAAPYIAERITETLGPDYVAEDWTRLNQSLFSALWLENMAISIAIGLIVMVGALNIISSLILLVRQKSRDIAILKTMGTSSRRVMGIFMAQGLVIGLVGTAVGGSAGALLCWVLDTYEVIPIPADVYQVAHLRFVLQPLDLLIVAVAATTICFLATIYPSRQAARLDPVQALRFE